MTTEDLHNDALELLREINKQIPDKNRLDTLNSMMTGVIRELNGQLLDNIIPKTAEDDNQ